MLEVLMYAEKVKPSVFLLVGVRKGIWPVKRVKFSVGNRITHITWKTAVKTMCICTLTPLI